MARRGPSRDVAVPPGEPRAAAWAQTILLVAILALMVARTMLGESPYSRRPMADAGAFDALPVSEQIHMPNEVARIAAAVAIIVLAAGWALAGLAAGRLQIHRPLLGVLVLAVIAALFASAAGAADKREALTTAAEQSTLVLAAWLTIQLARPAWRRRLVLIVLVALAALQGAKGLYQVYVEIPSTLADWQAHRSASLAATGQTVQSPEQRLLEARVVERTAKGYFSLANPYGSMLIVLLLAAAGLAGDKWQRWRAQGRAAAGEPSRAPPAARGTIPPAMLAAALTTLLAIPAAAALLLTESKGAIAAGAGAVAAAIAIYVVRGWARRHWRALTAAGLVALILAVAAIAAYGARRGGLPSRSMQVRWEYWVASVDILRYHPLLGVGPGNFPDAYLAHRLPGAEESVKNPHNVLVQALAEYGLIGGGLFLALLLWILAALGAPAAPAEPTLSHGQPRRDGHAAWLLLAVALAALAWRLVVTTYPNAIVAIYDNSLLLVFVAALFAAAWNGESFIAGLTGSGGLGVLPAIALGCGLWGFAAHNLTDFALFLAGAAMMFYVGAGTLLASKSAGSWMLAKGPAAGVSAALMAAAIAMAALMLAPALEKSAAVLEAAEAYSMNRFSAADAALARAVSADPLDAATAADHAGLLLRAAQHELSEDRARQLLQRAAEAMRLAVERQPTNAAYRLELLELQVVALEPSLLSGRWYAPPPDLTAAREKAGKLLREHPDNAALLSMAAQYAFQAGDLPGAAAYLDRAMRIADWPILSDHLGDVRFAAGDAESAKAAWRQFQQGRGQRFDKSDPSFDEAVRKIAALDGQNARLHIDLAQLAWQASRLDEITPLLDAALAADDALPPAVVMKLTEPEEGQIALLREKLSAVK